MKTLIDVLAALSDFVKIASEWAESASKAEVETFTQIYPQKEEAVKKAVEKSVTLEEVRSVLANLSRSGQKETVLKLLQKYGGTGRKVTFWFYRFSKGTASETRGIKAVWCFSRRICGLVRGGEADWNLTIMQTVYTQCFLLHPVLVGWRVHPPHSFVLSCRIP